MKLIKFILLFWLLTFAGITHANKVHYALIYNGISTCEGCPETIADVVSKVHIPVKFVSNPKNIPALLAHAAIFIIGGTDDNIEPMRLAFDKNTINAIKKYVNDGGKYLGICGGAFMAAKYYHTEKNLRIAGFDLFPATAINYGNTNQPHLETITWLGKEVTLYFQGGPTFLFEKNTQNMNIIAKYDNGEIAAFEYNYGKGKVIAIGPHPEADQTWLDVDGIKAPSWQPKQTLLGELIKSLF